MKVYFFDTETTGNGPDDRLCQLAIKEEGVVDPFLNEYFKPPLPIPPEASAVHHITNTMVASKETFQSHPRYHDIKTLFESDDTIVVAHNAPFDVGMLQAEGINPTNVICTLKVARHLDHKKEFAQYKLQYLRYALNIELDVPAHDAYADVVVLEQLFNYFLKRIMEEQSLERGEALATMKTMTETPVLMNEFPFGKYKGKTVAEVAATAPDYLAWLLAEKEKNPIGEDDWIYTLKKWLEKA